MPKTTPKTTPETVRIGPIDYELIRGVCHHNSYGECDYDNGCIFIREGMTPAITFITELHEYIHAILFNAGFSTDHDERMVDALANGLALLSRDNPGALAWPQ